LRGQEGCIAPGQEWPISLHKKQVYCFVVGLTPLDKVSEVCDNVYMLRNKEIVMYTSLLAEAKVIQDAWGYGLLEAIEYIIELEDQYPSEVRRELKQFLRDGARMFAPKVEMVLINSDGEEIV
jgi:hypothetical protein